MLVIAPCEHMVPRPFRYFSGCSEATLQLMNKVEMLIGEGKEHRKKDEEIMESTIAQMAECLLSTTYYSNNISSGGSGFLLHILQIAQYCLQS
jgi:hypothetical protein